jgi:heavy metal sensor kinase
MPRSRTGLGKTVRWRLTLWYTLVLFLSFAVFSAVVHRIVSRNLYRLVDRQLSDTLHAAVSVIDRSYQEVGSPSEAYLREELDEVGFSNQVALRLVLPDGRVNFFNARSFPDSLLNGAQKAESRPGKPLTLSDGARSWRVLSGRSTYGGPCQILLVRRLTPIEEQLSTLRITLLIALPLILLFAAASGYFLAARALNPVAQITTKARRIEAHALKERLEVVNPEDEIGQLTLVLNDLFARLDQAFQQQRQFLTDAAHELRTPAAILRSQAEVALEQSRSVEEYAATLAAMRAEIEQLSSIVDDLLLSARAESSQLPVVNEPVDLTEMLDEICRALRPLIHRKNLILRWEVGDEVSVSGDARLLRRALMNLLSNAIKYTPEGGTISASIKPDRQFAAIEIADTGMGVTPEDLPHIFDRFYRAVPSPDVEPEGSGLGLAIVKMIAELHGGRVAAGSDPGKGSTFVLHIPVAGGQQRDDLVQAIEEALDHAEIVVALIRKIEGNRELVDSETAQLQILFFGQSARIGHQNGIGQPTRLLDGLDNFLEVLAQQGFATRKRHAAAGFLQENQVFFDLREDLSNGQPPACDLARFRLAHLGAVTATAAQGGGAHDVVHLLDGMFRTGRHAIAAMSAPLLEIQHLGLRALAFGIVAPPA